jgi:hypothetical protein
MHNWGSPAEQTAIFVKRTQVNWKADMVIGTWSTFKLNCHECQRRFLVKETVFLRSDLRNTRVISMIKIHNSLANYTV